MTWFVLALGLGLGSNAWALEFGSAGALVNGVSASDAPIILYDGPTKKSRKVFLVSRRTPLEIVITLNEWIKIRHQDGTLAWVEKSDLGKARYVVVTVAQANIYQKPESTSSLVFRARKQVLLELLQDGGNGWLKVRHPDGETGYVRASDIWGA